MMRPVSFRLLAPLALLLGLGGFAFAQLPAASGKSETAPPVASQAVAATPLATTKVSARAGASNPAWGNSGVGYRYAFDGKCDDPRYAVTTGAADPGSDEQDCARFGGGLKK